MNYKTEKLKGNSYKINVDVSKEKVKETFDTVIESEKKNVKVDGFRKGKAPKNLVKESLDKSKVLDKVASILLQEAYSQILKESKFTPITYPFFDINDIKEDEDMKFVITIVEKPDMKIGDYKTKLKTLIKNKTDDKDKTADIEIKRIIDLLIEITEIDLAEILIESEKNRMLSSLIDQTAKMGLTIEDYLKSQKKTIDEIRKEYEVTAKNILKADFILTEIAKLEDIAITDKDIQDTINAIPDKNSQEILKQKEQLMYIKAVLLKNKVLDKLKTYINS